MANQVVMRCAKLKQMGNISSSLQHTFRDIETEHADPKLKHLNQPEGAESTAEALEKIRARLPEKFRKDAVRTIEYVFSASSEWWPEQTEETKKAFFDRSLGWLKDKYGEENVICSMIHNDEQTPHMAAYVVPVTPEGKLSAAQFIGSRGLLRGDQTAIWKAVEDLGLERGVEGSKAKHTTTKQYRKGLNDAMKGVAVPVAERFEPKKTGMLKRESAEQVRGRIVQEMRPTLAAAAELPVTLKRNEELTRVIQDQAGRLNRLKPVERFLEAVDASTGERFLEEIYKRTQQIEKAQREGEQRAIAQAKLEKTLTATRKNRAGAVHVLASAALEALGEGRKLNWADLAQEAQGVGLRESGEEPLHIRRSLVDLVERATGDKELSESIRNTLIDAAKDAPKSPASRMDRDRGYDYD